MNDQTPLSPSFVRGKVFLRYITRVAALNLVWETLQLPLYTLWSESPTASIAFAVVHCTLGDVLIATVSLAVALVLLGEKGWPQERYLKVALVSAAIGASYTVFSEWNNTVITRTWAYSQWMPTLWGIGLSPVLQWLLIPALVFWSLSKQRAGDRP